MPKLDISRILGEYRRYMSSGEKKELDARIIENNRWYRQQYTEYESREDREKEPRQPQYKSGYIFSAIANKHADAMDNYPDINILPREAGDVEEAKRLSDILPCVLELCSFKETYSKNWWYKLKNGTAVYGVFWNPVLNGGLGDIEIKKIDLLNLAWQPGISDIQDSKYLFYSYYMDKEAFIKKYGKDKLSHADDLGGVQTYGGRDFELLRDSVLVVDCYYKTDGKVHLVKFTGESLLEQTEGKAEYAGGVYEHGLYPFVLDVMYPNEDSPAGFGVVDVVKSPQAYIDKLDALLAENSLIVGKTRYFIKDNGGVNEDEFLDLSQPFVHVAGSLDERNIMQIQGQALPSQVAEQRTQKINELKEVIGNRDFQQGGTNGGVTAASAISVLQQAGDKLSRDLISASYLAYKSIIAMCVELIRQFYDVQRKFRITGDNGGDEFVTYDNSGLKPQPVYPEMGSEWEETPLRKPEFDVSLAVQKSNPFTKELQNQTVMQLWSAGFFNPQALELSMVVLDFMQFEGKDEMLEKLRELMQRQQAQQMQVQQIQQMQAGVPGTPAGVLGKRRSGGTDEPPALYSGQGGSEARSDVPQGDVVAVPIGGNEMGSSI